MVYQTRSQSLLAVQPSTSHSGSLTAPSGHGRCRRRSPPTHVPRLLFNGKIKPSDAHAILGTTFGLRFLLNRALYEKVNFESINTQQHAPPGALHHRFIEFRSKFSSALDGDDLYVVLVIVGKRRYVIEGTYDRTLDEENMSLSSVACHKSFKGDVGVCFLGKRQPQQFLGGLPRFRQVDDGMIYLRRALDAFVDNVADHVERGTAFKEVIRG